MSKLFWFSEFLEKSNIKNGSQIWKLLLIKGVKSLPNKGCLLANFALLAGFFWYQATIRIGWKILCLPYKGLFYSIGLVQQYTNFWPITGVFNDLCEPNCNTSYMHSKHYRILNKFIVVNYGFQRQMDPFVTMQWLLNIKM